MSKKHARVIEEKIKQQRKAFFDPLLECLMIITRLKKKPISMESLRSGLPLSEEAKFTPEIFVRAAERIGYKARLVKRKLAEVSPLVLPAVVLLHDKNACVLDSITADGKYKVIFPETDMGSELLTEEELAERYLGYIIYLKSSYQFEERTDQYKVDKPESWFWGTIWQYKGPLFQVIIAATMINLFVLAVPLFIMNVYDRVIPNNAIPTLWVLAIGIAIVFLFDFLMRNLRHYLVDISGKKIDTVLGSMIFQHVLGMKMRDRPMSVGSFTSQLREFESVREVFSSATLVAAIDLPFVFLILFVVWLVAGYLVFIPLIALPILIVLSWLFEIPVRNAIRKSYFGNIQKQALLVETVAGMESIKTLSAQSMMQEKWERAMSTTEEAGLRSKFYSGLMSNITTLTQQAVTVLIIIVGVYAIEKGDITVGALVAAMILTGRALAPIGAIIMTLTKFQRAKLALKSLDKLMQLPQERVGQRELFHKEKFHGDIVFDKATFRYPEQERPVLNKINFTIEAGEHVAILGKIGCGKSTLLKMILGLYEADDGAVLLDNTDLRQLDPADIRRNIGYVPQDCTLFYGTVRENIAMAQPWCEDEKVLQAALMAGVADFIRHDPKGFGMMIGERGENLSGGQRQSIGIARCLISESPIILLDEPTSAMDIHTKARMINMLRGYIHGRTLVVATHNREILQLVNRVIYLVEGKIEFDGSVKNFLDQSQKLAHATAAKPADTKPTDIKATNIKTTDSTAKSAAEIAKVSVQTDVKTSSPASTNKQPSQAKQDDQQTKPQDTTTHFYTKQARKAEDDKGTEE